MNTIKYYKRKLKYHWNLLDDWGKYIYIFLGIVTILQLYLGIFLLTLDY